MEKLTLEHIAPFLPYRLKGITKDKKYKEPEIGEINHWNGNANEDEQLIISTGFGYYVSSIGNTKPILRPMDLTKPITVDGKEVIPAMVLSKIVGDIHNDDLDDKWQFKDNGYVSVKTPWDLRIEMFYKTPTLMFSVYDTWNHKEKRTHNQMLAFKWLYVHLFDVDGLIDAGLAIDVNTLKTNPYN